MKIYNRISALITAFTMFLVSSSYTTAVAEDQETDVSVDAVESKDASVTQEVIDESKLIPIEEAMNDCRLLNYIDQEQFASSEFVYQIPSSEDLNSYAFVDGCGNKVVYIMDENTKFIDSNGDIIEKDLSLLPVEDGFEVADNDIGLLIPYDLSRGISMDYQGYTINLLPNTLSDKITIEELDGAVVYRSAFSDNTSLVYTPLLSGIKENIILSDYEAEASYDFTIKTNGLSAFCSDGFWYLATEEDASEKFNIGTVEIYDAIGKPGTGVLNLEETDNEGEYTVHIIADDEFLLAEDTVYPVTIDPSITVSDNTHGSNSIIDAPIFSGYPDSNFGGFVYDRIGTPSSTYGVGRTVVKLSGLTNTSDYQNMIADQITDVKFYAREAIGGSSQYINVYPLTNTTWTETGVTWNNIGNYNTAINCGSSMSNNQWTAFNITNLVKGWKRGTYSTDAGFIFINSNESNDECFCASEHSTSSYRPYVVVTYNTSGSGGGNSFENASALTLNTPVEVNVAFATEKRYFTYTPSSTGFYSFESSAISSGDPYGSLYNFDQYRIAYNDDYNGTRNFKITYHLISGIKYYFTASCFSNGTGSYNIKLHTESSPVAISTTTSVSVENSYSVSNSLSYQPKYYTFTPTVTGEYLFYSFSQSSDPKIWLYNSNLVAIDSNDDTAGNRNFRLSSTLNAGQTYYLVATHYGINTGNYTLGVGMSANIPTDDYYIKNIGSGLNIDIHGPGEQEWVHQWTFHTGNQEDWKIQKQSDGYYTIRSEFGDKKYIGISSTSTGSNNIKLYTSVSDNTRWKIYITCDGKLFFEPKNGIGKSLYAPDSVSGTELQLGYLSSSVSNRNKWIFEVKSSTPLEGQRWSQWCWATSARMLVNHYQSVPDSRTQNNAVNAVKGSVIDVGGTITDARAAAGYYIDEDTSNNDLELENHTGYRLTQPDLKKFIDDGHVVYIARGHYSISNNRNGGHATAVIGYTTEFNNGNFEYKFVINDPWPNPSPFPTSTPLITNGQLRIVSYDWICNGRKGLNGDPSDDGIWDKYMVVQTGYSQNEYSPIYN